MSVCHLRFDSPQDSFVCTCCGKFPVVDAAIAQDSIDHHLSLYCEECAGDIGPREVAGARTPANNARDEICPTCGGHGHVWSAFNEILFCRKCSGTGKLSPVA